MEETQTLTNGKTNTTTGNKKERKPRRPRPAPLAYSADDVRDVTFGLPKVAQKGIAFQSSSLSTYKPFSLTAGGEALYIKLNKSVGVRLSDGSIFDGADLTVYPLVW